VGVPDGSDVPSASTQPDNLTDVVEEALSDAGALARVVAGYEPRPGQRRMAAAVASIVDGGGTLLAEAGTGTGKTLAYLIPVIVSRRRALVSTGTKNLQEQIFFKDLPALREALGVPFTATLMKGRSNYLCLHRWEIYRDGVEGNASAGGRLIDSGDHVLLPVLQAWVGRTQTGDRAELQELPEDMPLWKDLAADADTCLGTECPRYGECFVTRMRQRAAESDVVIVNHHLLCADAAVRHGSFGEVIPEAPVLVVDEAHQLEDVATQYFGLSFSNLRVDDLVHDCERLIGARLGPRRNVSEETGHASRGGARDLAAHETDDVTRALGRVTERSRMFFSALSAGHVLRQGSAESRFRYRPDSMAAHAEDGMLLAGALEGLEATLALVVAGRSRSGAAPAADPGARMDSLGDSAEAVATLQRRAGELAADLRFLLRADAAGFVYYIETRGRGLFLRASPIDVSGVVREALFTRFPTVVLASATLTVDGSFAYVRGRLGVDGAMEVSVPSEFDYAHQTVLYLPRRMPPPRAPSFAQAVAREALALLTRTRGRAFVLFTSYAVLRTVQRVLEMALPYPLLVQGSAPRSALIERFRSTPHAVLLATSSFWQGVDVVGDALSCVIVDKLPFASPGDPVTAARIEAIAADGGDPFAEYQVPLAILALQQGLGRLIRHRSDRGVLAVFDPRLRTMGYGQRFLASLPPAPVTHDLDAVERFLI
jgi:ATP-dependent DNA helicase DinG